MCKEKKRVSVQWNWSVVYSCDRLGLTSLAYLWERNQKELLAEMADSGVNAILIKVAAMGLGEKDLGRTIGEMYPKLLQLVNTEMEGQSGYWTYMSLL